MAFGRVSSEWLNKTEVWRLRSGVEEVTRSRFLLGQEIIKVSGKFYRPVRSWDQLLPGSDKGHEVVVKLHQCQGFSLQHLHTGALGGVQLGRLVSKTVHLASVG